MTLRHILYPIAAAILTGLAVTSCVYDEAAEPDTPAPVTPEQPADSEPETATITLSLTAAPMGTSSRAEGDQFTDDEKGEDAAQNNELINNWFVAFIRDGKIYATADGAPGAVWNDRVSLELPRGTYSAIAFANIDVDNIPQKFKTIGVTLGQNWEQEIYSTDAPSETGNIPMSGYLENFEVRGTVNEIFAIEVVRMFSKVQFTFKNICEMDAVQINYIDFTPVYTGDIFMFPKYKGKPVPDSEPTVLPEFPAMNDGNTHYTTVKKTVNQSVISSNVRPEVKPIRSHFYIKESVAQDNHPTNHFHIAINMKRDSQTEAETVTALADDKLEYFYRNDYVLFPIVISDYTPELEVYDYPPIGGYPVQVENKGTEFYATFSSSGAFDILARLRDSQNRTVAIQPYDNTTTQDNYVRLVSHPDEIKLEYDAVLGLWKGDFDYKQGENKRLEIVFEFKIGTLVYTRTLYLLSE